MSSLEKALWRIPEWFPSLEEDKISKLRVFHVELLRFNDKMNLISEKTIHEADLIHIYDAVKASMLIIDDLPKNVEKIYDLGSGNGIPGLVMAILNPDTEFVLVDSHVKKAEFLRFLADKLSLTNVRVLLDRIEDLPKDSIDVAVCRGLASLQQSLLALKKLFSEHGVFYHLKGDEWATEVSEMVIQISSTWNIENLSSYSLPDNFRERNLVKASRKEA